MADYPPSWVPSAYSEGSTARANGVFLTGDTVTVTFAKSGATGYAVRDYYGNVVSSGSLSGSTTAVSPTPPSGGWVYGWYRLYLTGPTTDPHVATTPGYNGVTFSYSYGNSYGAYNFCVVPTDAALPAVPNRGAVFDQGGGARYADLVAHGTMDFGPCRIEISQPRNPTAGEFTLTTAQAAAAQEQAFWGSVVDTARPPRRTLCSYTDATFDYLYLPLGTAYNTAAASVYAATEALDPALLSVAKSGTALTVAYNGSTVETFNGVTTGTSLAAATASSAYVKVFASQYGHAGDALPDFTATAIASSQSARAGVIAVVSGTYPTVTAFEGPWNEPQAGIPAEVAHQMRLFAGAVHAGNPSAQAIGPCIVSIIPTWLDAFFAAGGGTWTDGISFHIYNMIDNDLVTARKNFDALAAVLTKYGLTGKPLWQTENGTVSTIGYGGVYHPRRAYWYLLETLLMEQYGLPKERNVLFNDTSHGFWGFPCWFVNSSRDLNPQGPMMRQLGGQLRGKAFTSRYQFGSIGDGIYLGSLYTNPTTGAKVAIFQACGPQLNGQVILTVSGASNLTVADCFGNTSTSVVSNGKVTLPVGETPVYVQLPAGVTATLYSFADWPPVAAPALGNNLNGYYAGSATSSATVQPVNGICDRSWTGYRSDGTAVPVSATVKYPSIFSVDRVLIHSGEVLQADASLVDFDIQTSTDSGATWTTRATVTRPTPTSFIHGTAASNVGCILETYQEAMRIFDVKLPAKVRCNAIRISVRAATWGGEPDEMCGRWSGQWNDPVLNIRQVTPLCDDISTARYVTKS